ncbi:MAG TPA: GNAT family N-acetyltransferase [Pyrinomonadaceae bacterium]|nr:GNAT family N-acetyltransferase [Pyrinomonadaceae bacterium]
MTLTTTTAMNSDDVALTTMVRTITGTNSLSVQPLKTGQEAEVLAFLRERPLHTFVMGGHILDNGLESPLNRGVFQACRDDEGKLEGVALIGHATLVETRSEEALACFARFARSCPTAHMIMGEVAVMDQFWRHYACLGQAPRRFGRELLLELQQPAEADEPSRYLRLATLDDLEQVMLIQGEMAFAESGINPLEADPIGFRLRCARRIELRRVWVWVEDDRLIFKADVISETPQVVYLEGIYVDPKERSQGYGSRCMSQLSRNLLNRTNSLCIFVNVESRRARVFFERIGFKLRGCYDTVFMA